jgi:hypothetical protein
MNYPNLTFYEKLSRNAPVRCARHVLTTHDPEERVAHGVTLEVLLFWELRVGHCVSAFLFYSCPLLDLSFGISKLFCAKLLQMTVSITHRSALSARRNPDGMWHILLLSDDVTLGGLAMDHSED